MIKIIPSRQILWYHGFALRSDAGDVQMSKTTIPFIFIRMGWHTWHSTLEWVGAVRLPVSGEYVAELLSADT